MPFKFQRTKPNLPMSCVQPPDKRRRMGNGWEPGPCQDPPRTSQEFPVPSVTDDDWGALDDDLGLTEDQLEELDLMASQAMIAPQIKPVIAAKPFQSNFYKPFTSLVNSRNAEARNVSKTKVQSNVPFYDSHRNDHYNNPGVQSSANSIGTNRTSSSINIGTKPIVNHGIMDMEMNRISAENDQYRSEISALKEAECVREGEILMLRQMLKQKESEIFKQKQNQSDVVDQQAKDHMQKQKELETQVEKLNAQMKFKDQEISEYSRSVKRLEQRLKTAAAPSSNNAGLSPVSYVGRISPKIERRRPPSPRISKSDHGFPTTDSFLAERPSPRKVRVETPVFSDSTSNTVTKVESESLPKRFKLNSSSNRGATMTGPLLVCKLQSESGTGVYRLLEMCQNLMRTAAMTNDLVKVCHIAKAGLAGLLAKNRDTTAMTTRPLRCQTSDAVHILPLISHIIDQYKQIESDEKAVKNMHKSDSKNTRFLDCLSSCLDVLLCLVSYSSDVRDAILDDVTRRSRTTKEMDGVSPVAGPSGDDGKMAGPERKMMKRCLLIIERLASQATESQMESFQPLVQTGVLSDVLTSSVQQPDVLSLAMRLVRDMAQSNKLLSMLCKQSDSSYQICVFAQWRMGIVQITEALYRFAKWAMESATKFSLRRKDQCTFYCIYTSLQRAAAVSSQTDQYVSLCEEFVALGSTIVGRHKGGATFLQEADCSCSEELPRTLALALHRLVGWHKKNGGSRSERTLRKGLMLIYMFSVRGMLPEHFSEGEMPYTSFVNEMKRLISALPDVSENEILAVRHLWDFDDDSGHEESSNSMDCDQQQQQGAARR